MNSSKSSHNMFYTQKYIFSEKLWNNALSYDERQKILWKTPILTIPSRIFWDIDDVKTSHNLVFEEVENGRLFSCFWLENFVQIERNNLPPIIVFDNHNHALFFWCEAIKNGIIEPNFELLHIDEHSDLWPNDNKIDDFSDLQKMWEFTNFSCNVGNYIIPAQKAGIVGNMIRIENEFQIDENIYYSPSQNSVLNLDLDIFSPELSHIPEEKIVQCIQNLLNRVKYATICTSPYFIEQWKAIIMLKKILETI